MGGMGGQMGGMGGGTGGTGMDGMGGMGVGEMGGMCGQMGGMGTVKSWNDEKGYGFISPTPVKNYSTSLAYVVLERELVVIGRMS